MLRDRVGEQALVADVARRDAADPGKVVHGRLDVDRGVGALDRPRAFEDPDPLVESVVVRRLLHLELPARLHGDDRQARLRT